MNKIILIATLLLVCYARPLIQARQQGTPTSAGTPGFRENVGQVRDQLLQARDDIQFQLNATDKSVYVGQGTLHYQWNYSPESDTVLRNKIAVQEGYASFTSMVTYRLDVALLDANPNAKVITENLLPDVDVYYTNGLDGARARSFGKITYQNIYPGIDWVLYVRDGVLKYDFVLHPGADVSAIKMHYSGATNLSLLNGSLVATTPMGTLTEQKPYSYIAGTGQTVASAFLLDQDIVRFRTDPYEGTLVIDPLINLEWATYYGGSGLEKSFIWGTLFYSFSNTVTTDYMGNVYLCGVTDGRSNIATTGAHQNTFAGGEIVEAGTEEYLVYGDAFLVKFDSTGRRIWATYYGGERNEHTGNGHSVACDTLGNVYLAGSSNSLTGIATAGAHQTALCDPESYKWKDNFLVKFNGEGRRQWATYYGGRGHEEGGTVLVSQDGKKVYLCASATSYENIASPGAAITTVGNAQGVLWNIRPTGYIARFDDQGRRIWGSYIGRRETTNPIYDGLLDREGYIYLTGWTQEGLPDSISIATPGSFQVLIGGGPDPRPPDAFLQKWDSSGKRLWGTFYGGDSGDMGFGLATDDSANVYMAGYTRSANGTTHGSWSVASPGSMQPTLSLGAMDAFIAKFNGAGQRQWGTYYGAAEGQETITSIAYSDQKLYAVGLVGGKNYGLSTDCAYQVLSGGGPAPSSAFLARFSTDGVLDYCSYYGGKKEDYGFSIAIDKTNARSVYIAGYTASPDAIATKGAYQETLSGSWDAYLAKFVLPTATEISLCFQADSIFIEAEDTSGSLYQWSNGVTGRGQWVKTSGTYWITYEERPACLTTDTFIVHIYPLPVLSFLKSCVGEGAAKIAVAPANKNVYTYTWRDGSGNVLQQTESKNGDSLRALVPGNYTLHILTPIGCDTTLSFTIEAYPAVDLTVCNDTTIMARGSVRLWATGALTYQWQPETWLDNPSSASPLALPEEPITYTVTGWNEHGCQATKEVRIDIIDSFFIPNAFSPNGDGLNDEFRIVNFGYQRLEAFQIFNRWGALVFSTLDPDKGWRGTYKDVPADLGTYHYYIRLQLNDGTIQTFKGNVALVR